MKDIECLLMTSHLESCSNHTTERKNQLRRALDEMVKSEKTVLFGGDLNLRDREVYISPAVDLSLSYPNCSHHLLLAIKNLFDKKAHIESS